MSEESLDDIDAGPSYATPPPPQPSRRRLQVYATRQRNVQRSSPVPTAVAEKLKTVCPPQLIERCLITNEHEPKAAIDKCHVLARRSSFQRLRQLEYAWGVPPNSLNVDSTRNLVYLRSDLHRSFDDGDWALLPSTDTLLKIFKDTGDFIRQNGKMPDYRTVLPDPPDGQFWTYSFIPIKLLQKDVVICLRDLDENVPVPSSSTSTSMSPNPQSHVSVSNRRDYIPPYTNFPKLVSQVHPYFAIINIGDKFYDNLSLVTMTPELSEIWTHLVRIWTIWTKDPPEEWMLSPPPPPEPKRKRRDDNDDDGEGGRRTLRSRTRAMLDASQSKGKSGGKAMQSKGNAGQSAGKAKQSKQKTKVREAQYPSPPLDEDNSSYSPVTYPESIEDWLHGVAEQSSKWKLPLDNTGDYGVMQYAKEKARRPRKASWDLWRTKWSIDPKTNWPVRFDFSSNDWAVYHHMLYLPMQPDLGDTLRYEKEEKERAVCGVASSEWPSQ